MPDPDWLLVAKARGLVVREGPTPKLPAARLVVADLPAGLSEEEFLNAVIRLARSEGWKLIHVRPARTARGWRTAVQGDGKGFTDLLMLHPPTGRLLVAELKCGRKTPTPEQLEWLAAFKACGVPSFVWRPRDWSSIREVLARDRGGTS